MILLRLAMHVVAWTGRVMLDLPKLAAAVTWRSSWTTACYHQSSDITALGTGPNSAVSRTDCKKSKMELSNIV